MVVCSVPVRAYNITPYGVTTNQSTRAKLDNQIIVLLLLLNLDIHSLKLIMNQGKQWI